MLGQFSKQMDACAVATHVLGLARSDQGNNAYKITDTGVQIRDMLVTALFVRCYVRL